MVSNKKSTINRSGTKQQYTYPGGGGGGGERGGEGVDGREGGGGKKNDTEERRVVRSPVSFSSEKKAEELRPLPLLSLEDMRQDPGPGEE